MTDPIFAQFDQALGVQPGSQSAQPAQASGQSRADEIRALGTAPTNPYAQSAQAPLGPLGAQHVQTAASNVKQIYNTANDSGQQQIESGNTQLQKGMSQFGQPGVMNKVKGVVNSAEGVMGMGAGAVGKLTAPLAPVMQPVTSAIQATGDVLGSLPGATTFANSKLGQLTTRGVQDISNTANVAGTALGGVESVRGIQAAAPTVASGVQNLADRAPGALQSATEAIKAAPGAIKDATLGTPESRFNSNLNKALPVLKADVKNLPAKQYAARRAIQDMVDNKATTGIVDSNGVPKNPSNFQETVQAQGARMKDIYNQYTARLETADKAKFTNDIHTKIFDKMDEIKAKSELENSVDNRKALGKIQAELGSLRDTSPRGIQNYIESINQKTKTAPGAPMTSEQVQYANLGGDMRKILDSSMEKINGTGYQDLRSTYGAHKQIESQLLMAAKKEMNNVPGLTDKLTTLGLNVEGINFLMTHNPAGLITAAGVKGAAALIEHFKSPQAALGRLFKLVENQSKSKGLNEKVTAPVNNQ